MASGNSGESPEVQPQVQTILRRELWLTLLFLVVLITLVALAGVFFRAEITAFANWVYHRLGFVGLSVFFFLSEALVTPLPPDITLMIVAGSELRESWLLPVLFLSFLSTLGGHVGWLLGLKLDHTGLVRRMLGRHHGWSVELMRSYGVWAIVLAALTPLPWSVTSWTAGALHMPWRSYLLGSLARAPRIILYYVFIHAAFQGL